MLAAGAHRTARITGLGGQGGAGGAPPAASTIRRTARLVLVSVLPGVWSWSSIGLSFQETIRSRLGKSQRVRLPPCPLATTVSGGAKTKRRLPSRSKPFVHQL